MKDELFPLVDESGKTIGRATRSYCHSGSMALHPVVHLHVIDENGKILLQRRSKSKDIQPGKWDTAVGGHVDYGEEIFEALLREAREELGIDASFAEKVDSYVFQSYVEKELVNTFFLKIEDPASLNIKADPIEIEEVRFWSPDEIKQVLGKGILTPNFEMEFKRIYPLILNKI